MFNGGGSGSKTHPCDEFIAKLRGLEEYLESTHMRDDPPDPMCGDDTDLPYEVRLLDFALGNVRSTLASSGLLTVFQTLLLEKVWPDSGAGTWAYVKEIMNEERNASKIAWKVYALIHFANYLKDHHTTVPVHFGDSSQDIVIACQNPSNSPSQSGECLPPASDCVVPHCPGERTCPIRKAQTFAQCIWKNNRFLREVAESFFGPSNVLRASDEFQRKHLNQVNKLVSGAILLWSTASNASSCDTRLSKTCSSDNVPKHRLLLEALGFRGDGVTLALEKYKPELERLNSKFWRGIIADLACKAYFGIVPGADAEKSTSLCHFIHTSYSPK